MHAIPFLNPRCSHPFCTWESYPSNKEVPFSLFPSHLSLLVCDNISSHPTLLSLSPYSNFESEMHLCHPDTFHTQHCKELCVRKLLSKSSWNVKSNLSYCTGRKSARLLNPGCKIYGWQFVYSKVTNGRMQDSRAMRPWGWHGARDPPSGSCEWMPPWPMFLLPHMNHTTCILSRQLCHQS